METSRESQPASVAAPCQVSFGMHDCVSMHAFVSTEADQHVMAVRQMRICLMSTSRCGCCAHIIMCVTCSKLHHTSHAHLDVSGCSILELGGLRCFCQMKGLIQFECKHEAALTH